MRTLLIVMLISMFPLLAFAEQDELWLEGLTLPPDAVVVNSELQELLAEEYVGMIEFLDEDREPLSMQMLDFNLDSGWQAVESHYAHFQQEQGWLDARTERIVRRLMDKKGYDRELALEKAEFVKQQTQAIAGGMLEYCDPEQDIYLVVMDNTDALKMMQAMADEYKLPDPQFGRYAVVVIWMNEAAVPPEVVETDAIAEPAGALRT
ncbi:hypothetical protein KDL44_11245 [bacterium]|nr:hypothetical protein [bacterium]